jgi:hypothetical protein
MVEGSSRGVPSTPWGRGPVATAGRRHPDEVGVLNRPSSSGGGVILGPVCDGPVYRWGPLLSQKAPPHMTIRGALPLTLSKATLRTSPHDQPQHGPLADRAVSRSAPLGLPALIEVTVRGPPLVRSPAGLPRKAPRRGGGSRLSVSTSPPDLLAERTGRGQLPPPLQAGVSVLNPLPRSCSGLAEEVGPSGDERVPTW